MNDIQTVEKMNALIQDEGEQRAVEAARIHSPAKEMSNCVASFVTRRLDRLESDAQFADLVKMNMRGRFPEFTVDQLIQLNADLARANNEGVDQLMKLFRNENSGKTIVEHLRENDTESAAIKVYNETDNKDILQAIGYFTQVIEKAANRIETQKGE